MRLLIRLIFFAGLLLSVKGFAGIVDRVDLRGRTAVIFRSVTPDAFGQRFKAEGTGSVEFYQSPPSINGPIRQSLGRFGPIFSPDKARAARELHLSMDLGVDWERLRREAERLGAASTVVWLIADVQPN